MIKLSKRLEIRLDKKTFDVLAERAKTQHKSIGELIRSAIRQTFQPQSGRKRRSALQKLFSLNAPVSDWPQMEKDIEKGYR
jgi:hypothetical protein